MPAFLVLLFLLAYQQCSISSLKHRVYILESQKEKAETERDVALLEGKKKALQERLRSFKKPEKEELDKLKRQLQKIQEKLQQKRGASPKRLRELLEESERIEKEIGR